MGLRYRNPGPRVFLQPVMSHPDPAGSSSCPWKTCWEAGLKPPASPGGGHTRSRAGTHTHTPFLDAEILFGTPSRAAGRLQAFPGQQRAGGKEMKSCSIFPQPSFAQPPSFHPSPRLPTHTKTSRRFQCQAKLDTAQNRKSQREGKEKKKQKNFHCAEQTYFLLASEVG